MEEVKKNGTETAGVLDETMHDCRLELDALLHVGVHFFCPVSKVKKVGSQYHGQVTAVHLVLCAPATQTGKLLTRCPREEEKKKHHNGGTENFGTSWTHRGGSRKSGAEW